MARTSRLFLSFNGLWWTPPVEVQGKIHACFSSRLVVLVSDTDANLTTTGPLWWDLVHRHRDSIFHEYGGILTGALTRDLTSVSVYAHSNGCQQRVPLPQRVICRSFLTSSLHVTHIVSCLNVLDQVTLKIPPVSAVPSQARGSLANHETFFKLSFTTIVSGVVLTG